MLVLQRKKDETVVIDGETVIQVLEIRGSYVRLGIIAPRKVKVLRGELCQKSADTAPQPSEQVETVPTVE